MPTCTICIFPTLLGCSVLILQSLFCLFSVWEVSTDMSSAQRFFLICAQSTQKAIKAFFMPCQRIFDLQFLLLALSQDFYLYACITHLVSHAVCFVHQRPQHVNKSCFKFQLLQFQHAAISESGSDTSSASSNCAFAFQFDLQLKFRHDVRG